MTKTSALTSLALAVALTGCEAPKKKPAPAARPEPVVAAPSTPRAADDKADKAEHITWTNAIEWRRWEDALANAKAENKAIAVVVYAHWCALCRELAPEFARPDVGRAAADLIMVRQDQDEHPPWLKEQLGKYGDYIPRVIFLSPDGTVREDLVSSHPRYPYFYAAMVTDRLIANMRAASKR